MASADPRGRALLERYLDPTRSWSGAEEARLRSRIDESEDLRHAYDRAVVAHRLMVGSDPSRPTGFEARRMRQALVEQTSGGGRAASSGLPWVWTGWLAAAGGVAAMCAVALFMLGPASLPLEDDGQLVPRGPGDPAGPLVGIGISGVTEGGGEYEVIASGEAQRSDWFRFYWTNERPELGHLFIVGLQADRPPVWYAPLPPEESESLPITTGRTVKLPFESRLAARHVTGPLLVLALFTSEPLTIEMMARKLDPTWLSLPDSERAAAVAAALELQEEDVVQTLQTRVLDPPPASPAHPHHGGTP